MPRSIADTFGPLIHEAAERKELARLKAKYDPTGLPEDVRVFLQGLVDTPVLQRRPILTLDTFKLSVRTHKGAAELLARYNRP